MLNVIFYQSNQDLLNKLSMAETTRVVCPSPLVADNLRSMAPELDILTISKWTGDHLKSLGLERSRKSELMVKLAGFWRIYFPEEKAQFFHEAFEHFTELRSFTLNLDLLSDFFKELDEKITKSIFIFWTYLQQENLIDEHLSYQKILDSQTHKSFSVVGFKNMSGIQIDMLKSIGQEHIVDIYLPYGIYEESLNSDWIRWLDIDPNEMKELKKFIEEEKAQEEDLLGSKEINVLYVQKGKGNVGLEAFYKHFPDHDIIFSGSQLELNHLQEVQAKSSFFKTNEDIFSNELNLLFEELVIGLEHGAYELEAFKEKLGQKQKTALKEGQYKLYKVLEIILAALELFTEFQNKIDHFGLEILKMVSLLNMPRVSLITIEKEIKRNISDLASLQFRDDAKPVAIYASENLSGFKIHDKILSEEMTKALRAIGPIKRAGLEFVFQKIELLNILANSQAVLIIEKNILDSDISWREILKKFEVKDLNLALDYKLKRPKDYLKDQIEKKKTSIDRFSATKIQSFIDCPRSYYFKYIKKIDNEPEAKLDINARDLGNIEHKVIQEYFNYDLEVLKIGFDPKRHEEIARREFDRHLEEEKIEVSEAASANAYNELLHYSLNGIMFLIEFIQKHKVISVKIEQNIPNNPWNLTGNIDCVVECENDLVHVFDFKRSATGVGSKKETTEFSKIQIWVYIVILHFMKKKIGAYGYLNLGEIEKSNLINSEFINVLDEETIEMAKEKILAYMQAMRDESEYLDLPKNAKACDVCKVNLFCLKGAICE